MMKGALDRVMQHCRPLEPADQEALLNAARTMGSKGLRGQRVELAHTKKALTCKHLANRS